MLFLIALGSGSLIYLVKRIHWLLVKMDIELRHQSTKKGHEKVVKEIGNVHSTSKHEGNRLLELHPGVLDRSDTTGKVGSYEKANQMM